MGCHLCNMRVVSWCKNVGLCGFYNQRCAPCLLKSMHGTSKRSNPKKNISMICDNKCCDDTIVLEISCSVYSWSMDAFPKELFGSLQFFCYNMLKLLQSQFNSTQSKMLFENCCRGSSVMPVYTASYMMAGYGHARHIF